MLNTNTDMMDSKSQLAKLMATEDLTVRQSNTAKTASFDIKSRTLTLPNWQDVSEVVDLLIGHEVGHALWTKMDDWEGSLKKGLHQGITNVVEDARIERKIKIKYPGLVRFMVYGYRNLEKRGFFYSDYNDIEKMNLVDRINLHCKLGPLAGIPFYSEAEKRLVEMTENTSTWKSVEETVLAIMDHLQNNAESQGKPSTNFDDIGGDFSDYEFGDDDDGEDFDELQNNDDDGEDSEHKSTITRVNKSGESGENGDDPYNLDSDLTIETQERFDDKVSRLLADSNDRKGDINYFTLPEAGNGIVISHKIAHSTLKEVMERQALRQQAWLKERPHYIKGDKDTILDDASDFRKFRNQAQKIVSYMAKEFERKKSANEYRKESISKTGVLDMGKIFSYKYNEDLFLRNTIRPDGKSHGLVMLFDWSASMTYHLHDTMKQTLALAWFCQKVNIPFEVYTFQNCFEKSRYDEEGRDLDYRAEVEKRNYTTWKPAKPGQAFFCSKGDVDEAGSGYDSFKLVNILSCRMNSKNFLDQSRMLFNMTKTYQMGRQYGTWSEYELTSTPLLEAFCGMNSVLPGFRKANKLDIVNLIVLTDGEGNGRFDGRRPESEDDKSRNIYLRGDWRLVDEQTKKVYSNKEIWDQMPNGRWYDATMQEIMVLKLLKDRHNVNIIGMFIDGESRGRALKHHTIEKFLGWKMRGADSKWTALRQMVRKNGVGVVSFTGYDEYYLIPVGTIMDKDSELEIEKDMTVGKMKNAFKKNLSQKFGNKVLVNKMMELIA